MADESTSLEDLPAEVMRLVDALDAEALGQLVTEDAQGIDEISRRWMRGRGALEQYFEHMRGTVTDLDSTVRDVHAVQWGDTGAVTFVIDQSYRYEGEPVQITAPTSLLCRREAGRWKIAVFHSAPLPEEPGA